MRFTKYNIFLGIILTLIGCTKELPLPKIESSSMIVVNSLFSPDSVLIVHITQNCDISKTACRGNIIEDASVIIKNELGNSLGTLDYQGNGLYSLPTLIANYNSTYQVEVTSGTLPIATAKSSVPKDFSCNYISHEEKIYDNLPAWTFNVEIVDNPNEVNYYLLEGYIEVDGVKLVDTFNFSPSELVHSAHYTNDVNAENKTISGGHDIILRQLRRVYLPDANFNGKTYRTSFAVHDYDVQNPFFKKFRAHILIKSVSKDMYDYFKSLEKDRLSKENPISEAVQIHTNISGGLGIFAAYSQKSFVVDLPQSEHVDSN